MSNHNKETEAHCFHCYRHYVEGTAAWALYMMRMGHKITNPMYDQRVYHLPEGGMIHVNGIKSIAGSEWIDYWCIDIPDGWKIYEEPKPELKPLLADAKPGWLAKLPDGTWFQLLSRYSDPRCNNEISFGVPYFPHISYDIDGKPRHFGGQNIIHVEPLATEGTTEWAWQMLLLGKKVCFPDVDDSSFYEMGYRYVYRRCRNHSNSYTKGRFLSDNTSGWQIYEEPEPAESTGGGEVKEIPYIAIGNEELAEALAVNEGDIVSIVVGGIVFQSPVVFGWKIVNGEKIPSDLIGAVKLPDDRIILVAVSGKLLPGVALIERKK